MQDTTFVAGWIVGPWKPCLATESNALSGFWVLFKGMRRHEFKLVIFVPYAMAGARVGASKAVATAFSGVVVETMDCSTLRAVQLYRSFFATEFICRVFVARVLWIVYSA